MVNLLIHPRYKDNTTNLNFDQVFDICLTYFAKIPDHYDCTIILAGKNRVRQLNNQYRGINSPTDVLSFSSGDMDPETGRIYLGDIIIAYQIALEQARRANHSIETELCILVVHGILHLLGYDHADDHQKDLMWKFQKEILDRLSISVEIP